MHPARRVGGLELLFAWMVQWTLVFCVLRLCGCADGSVGAEQGLTSLDSVVACTVSTVRHPTTETEFTRLYAGRGFLVDNVHIGHDVRLSEGTSIYPIACGTIRIYRAAQGYGTLVVVIEHHLPAPITVRNGLGVDVSVQNFLSIYGHLRKTSLRTGGTALAWRDGDSVRPDQVIGYVQNAADNGDGGEHLHLGIRLQSAPDAQATEPAAWFAGYDTAASSRRRWYADPALFMSALLHRSTRVATATWHPSGAVFSASGQNWLVTGEGLVTQVADSLLRSERMDHNVVLSTPSELACMTQVGLSLAQTSGHHLLRFNDASTVYEYADAPSPIRYSFLAQQAFDSWGWNGTLVETRNASERPAFFARYRDLGSRRLRDGSLVKAAGQSAVYVVSAGQRRPIFNEPTLFALGYDYTSVIEVDSSVLDVLAGPLGSTIRLEDTARCASAPQSMERPIVDAGSLQDVGSSTPIDAGARSRDVPLMDTSISVAMDVVDVPLGVSIDRPMPDLPTSRDEGVPMSLNADVGVTSAGSCQNPPPSDLGSATIADAGTRSEPVDVPRVSVEPPPPPPPVGAVMRYEFRLANDVEGWMPTEPYRLRDRYWVPVLCLNTIGIDLARMMAAGQGWFRCDTASRIPIFVGSFFSPSHLTQGDRGNIGTVGPWPDRCTATPGVEWRISDLTNGREVYHGPSSGLACTHVDTQDRHALP